MFSIQMRHSNIDSGFYTQAMATSSEPPHKKSKLFGTVSSNKYIPIKLDCILTTCVLETSLI